MKTYWIYLLRHGLIEGNLTGKYIGQTDVPLIDEGIDLLKAMKEKYIYPPVDEYFTAPLTRCRQTMEILYPDAQPIVVPELTEYDFGAYENVSRDRLKDDEQYKKWLDSDTADAAPPGGESTKDFVTRVCTAFNGIVKYMMSNGQREAVICTHGGVISTILAMYGLPQRPRSDWSCLNGKGYCIKITPSVWMREGMFEVAGLFPLEKEE